MPKTKSGKSILRQEAIGFFVIIILTWIVELIQLPHLLYGEPPAFNWSRVILRTVVVIGIWLWVYLATRRLLKRLHQLEEFLHVCSWCRKVGHEGEWLTMEEYFGSNFSTQTSHGICPECAKNLSNRLTEKITHEKNAGGGI